MTRDESLNIAKQNYKAYQDESLQDMKNGGDGTVTDAYERFGYRYGWIVVGEFSFNHEDLTGEKYDPTQSGWAFI